MVYHGFSTFRTCLLVWVLASILGGQGGGFWPSCVRRPNYLSLSSHWLIFCYLPSGVFVSHDNHVPCWHILFGVYSGVIDQVSIFVEQKAGVTASL